MLLFTDVTVSNLAQLSSFSLVMLCKTFSAYEIQTEFAETLILCNKRKLCVCVCVCVRTCGSYKPSEIEDKKFKFFALDLVLRLLRDLPCKI
jgi:hypothetical protein